MTDQKQHIPLSTFHGMVEIPLTIERLPVLFRQRDYGFFPSWMYAVNITLLELPIGFIDTFLWTIVVYWLVGMTATAGQYVDWNQVGNLHKKLWLPQVFCILGHHVWNIAGTIENTEMLYEIGINTMNPHR